MLITYPLTPDALAELVAATTPTRYVAHREPERARQLRRVAETLPTDGTDWMPPADDPLRRRIACELRRRARYEFTDRLSADQAHRLAALVMAEDFIPGIDDLLTGTPQEV